MTADFIARMIGTIAFAIVGGVAGYYLARVGHTGKAAFAVLLIIMGSAGIGLLITPYFTIRPFRWLRTRLRVAPAADILAGSLGLIGGLLISVLLAIPLSSLPAPFNWIVPASLCVLFCWIGIFVATSRKDDFASLFMAIMPTRHLALPAPAGGVEKRSGHDEPILLDTSAIIDGRVADISHTGFINGTLMIPRFVLDELQHIADSSDALRRNRGRRGLDMLNKLQKDAVVPVQISELDVDGTAEVDAKLVKLARQLHCPIITNDFNLNRVAELQGVVVLNINELANAVKPVVLPGEEMVVKIIQEGKEFGQGVGYLDDGTMIVVENGRRAMNSTVDVVVTRVLQTVAGRMIFAHPKHSNMKSEV